MSKKSYFTTLTVVFILCGLSVSIGYNIATPTETTQHQLDSVGQDTIVKTQVLKFNYDNQEYIEFLRDGNSFMIHDPNYHVLKNNLNNITTVINRTTIDKVNNLDANDRANFRVIIAKLNALETRLARIESNQSKIMKQNYRATSAKTIAKRKK